MLARSLDLQGGERIRRKPSIQKGKWIIRARGTYYERRIQQIKGIFLLKGVHVPGEEEIFMETTLREGANLGVEEENIKKKGQLESRLESHPSVKRPSPQSRGTLPKSTALSRNN